MTDAIALGADDLGWLVRQSYWWNRAWPHEVALPGPLGLCSAKLRRALQHAREAAALVERYIANNPVDLDVLQGDAPDRWVLSVLAVAPLPEDLAVVVGEYIQQLRSALEHSMLAWLACDLGRDLIAAEERRCQFPITDNADAHFAGLDGLSPLSRVLLRSFQPHTGSLVGLLLGQLRDLSNTDKHRRLLLAGCESEGITYDAPWVPAPLDSQWGRPLRPRDTIAVASAAHQPSIQDLETWWNVRLCEDRGFSAETLIPQLAGIHLAIVVDVLPAIDRHLLATAADTP